MYIAVAGVAKGRNLNPVSQCISFVVFYIKYIVCSILIKKYLI